MNPRSVALVWLFCLLTAHAAPLRLAIPPAPSSPESADPLAMTLNYLHERLGAHDEIELATPAWTHAILASLSPERVRAPEAGLLAMVRDQLPVDAVIRVNDGSIELHTATGVQSWEIPPDSTQIRHLATELAGALGRGPDPSLSEVRYPDERLFMAHYGLPAYHVPWPRNTAALKLQILGPIRHAYPDDPFIADALLQAAIGVLAIRRPEPDELKLVNALVPLALPTVLGTHHEATAVRLLVAKEEPFIAEVMQIVAAPVAGEVSMDTLLDGELGGGETARPPVSLARKIGALRVLAQVNPERAASPLAEARRSDIEKLKAAAMAIGQPPKATPPPPPDLHGVREELVLAALLQPLADADRGTVVRLANTAYMPIAQAAQQALAPLRPADGLDADRFDLQVAHPYLRKQILDRHAQNADLLAEACANPDPPTRTHALSLIAAVAPETASPMVEAALGDPHLWVRLHAASLLTTPSIAPSEESLRKALQMEQDPVIRVLLQRSLGIEGKPRPAARSVKDRPNLRWLCGYGADAVHSPIDAYYVFKPDVTPLWQEASEAGKIFFSRLSPIGNPGAVITDLQGRDDYWLALIRQLPPELLPYLDGVVYGEETMNMTADNLWPSGWRLFCLDAGLDPARIDGNPEALSEVEREAWLYWARERCVDGFNELYRFTKLYFGVLRPGLQVATFLPKEVLLKDGSWPPDRRMQFDVNGIYDYKGCNRLAGYWLVRRLKTLWPDRPVMWLSLGIGGYEMNPVRHDHKPPTVPLISRAQRAYADALSAWLAGAQAGWFSVWIFVDPTFTPGRSMSGVQVGLEDITDTDRLRRGADLAFKGVEEIRLTQQDAKNAPTLGEEPAGDDLGFTLQERPDPRKVELEKIATEKTALIQGMQLYQKYVYDCIRVIGDLPERPTPAPVLAVRDGISVWSRDGERPLIPGFGLFQSGDFICEINQLPYLDLSRYRIIAIHDPPRLRDETITALTSWLRDTDGILYIHRDLTADNAREMPTPEDLDGHLTLDWPWEKDLVITTQEPENAETDFGSAQIVASITGGDSLAIANGKSVLARWRHADFKGTVIVDGLSRTGSAWLDHLARHIPAVTAPWFVQQGESGGVTITSGSRYYSEARQPFHLAGQDLLTGEENPLIGVDSSGGVATSDHQGAHTVVYQGLAILADSPFDSVERLPNGLRLRGGGLIRVRAAHGRQVVVSPELPLIEQPLELVLSKEAVGRCTIPIENDLSIIYLRSPGPITLTTAD